MGLRRAPYVVDGVTESEAQAEERRLNFRRASGSCVCEMCGKEFRDHAVDAGDKTYDGVPILVVLCNFDRVKL